MKKVILGALAILLVFASCEKDDVAPIEESYTVTFNVTDSLLNPVEFAHIFIGEQTLVTNAAGQKTVDMFDGDYAYKVMASGYMDAELNFTVAGDVVTVDIVLKEIEQNVTLFVTDTENNPIENAAIQIGDEMLTTNAIGQVSVDLSAGDYNLMVKADGFLDYEDNLSVSGEGVTVNVAMTAMKYTIGFNVMDSASNAIKHAIVFIDGQTIVTNESGEASIELFKGTHSYKVVADGFIDLENEVMVEGEEDIVDITMSHVKYSVSFSVSDDASNAIEYANVVIGEQTYKTDGSGSFAIDLMDGVYEVLVSANGFNDFTITVIVSGENVQVDVSMEQKVYMIAAVVEADWNIDSNNPGTFISHGTEYMFKWGRTDEKGHSNLGAAVYYSADWNADIAAVAFDEVTTKDLTDANAVRNWDLLVYDKYANRDLFDAYMAKYAPEGVYDTTNLRTAYYYYDALGAVIGLHRAKEAGFLQAADYEKSMANIKTRIANLGGASEIYHHAFFKLIEEETGIRLTDYAATIDVSSMDDGQNLGFAARAYGADATGLSIEQWDNLLYNAAKDSPYSLSSIDAINGFYSLHK